MSMANPVIDYHNRTKHALRAYAKGPEYLDWDDQPNPFRRFIGCEAVPLPTPGRDLPLTFADLDTPQPPQAVNLANLGLLLELSFGLSAWKQFGDDRWALRCNPSSGNLHPTEAYLVCTDSSVFAAGVYHYVSHDHRLERRCQFDARLPAAFYIGLSSIHWREAWKYGERAFRYCQHDVGHALAALSYAAACLGWRVALCSEIGDAELSVCLGLNRLDEFVKREHEHPDLLCRLVLDEAEPAVSIAALCETAQGATWFGKAEALSGRHFFHWPMIDQAAQLTEKPPTAVERWQAPAFALPLPSHNLSATQLIRQRRSAQRFNAKADALPLADFYRLLAALLPNAKAPFNAWNWPAAVHIVLFVHRVDGLNPGLYCLPRHTEDLAALPAAMSAEFVWQSVPAPIPLFLLQEGDMRTLAKTLSCHQAIASNSAFSLAMLARFADSLHVEAWCYRRLFWECGLLGQILYLEAEAAGVRGTGIGCFFDDEVHALLGLADNQWQSLYHFTVGVALIDSRLQSLPAYAHLAPTPGGL